MRDVADMQTLDQAVPGILILSIGVPGPPHRVCLEMNSLFRT